jgi:CheY-like chemotaxis protein
MNVLIVDDNHTSCQLLSAVLEGEGHAVIVAEDGQEALVLLERLFPTCYCRISAVTDFARRSAGMNAGATSL